MTLETTDKTPGRILGKMLEDHGVKLSAKSKLSHSEILKSAIDSNDEEVLSHYGVLGMKWGVRKSRRGLSGKAKVGDVATFSNGKKAKVVSNRRVKGGNEVTFEELNSRKSNSSHMSNEEIQKRIARIKLEQELSRLTTPAPKAGQEFIKGVLKTSGQQILTKALTSGGIYLSGKLLGKLTTPDLERMIIGGGGGGKNKKK